jgi:pimeloyl-ACP methyl ester carboxylesterase
VIAEEMTSRIPDARLVRFEGGAHTLPIEYPDEITAELRPFLDGVLTPS